WVTSDGQHKMRSGLSDAKSNSSCKVQRSGFGGSKKRGALPLVPGHTEACPLRLRLAALALPLIGDEEADKPNNLLGNRSRNQGLNRCVAWTATAKAGGSNETTDALPCVKNMQK